MGESMLGINFSKMIFNFSDVRANMDLVYVLCALFGCPSLNYFFFALSPLYLVETVVFDFVIHSKINLAVPEEIPPKLGAILIA